MKPSEILKLSIPERILLVETIWDSIAAESKELDIPEYHKQILKEELIAYKLNPHEGSTWEEVKKRVKRKKNYAIKLSLQNVQKTTYYFLLIGTKKKEKD